MSFLFAHDQPQGKTFDQLIRELTTVLEIELTGEQLLRLQHEWRSRLVRRGLQAAVARGRPLGRPRETISAVDLARTAHLSTRQAGEILGVSHATVHRARCRAAALAQLKDLPNREAAARLNVSKSTYKRWKKA